MKNREMEVIHRRMARLEQIMIDEGNKGHGYSTKAKRALSAYQELEKQISYIQFHKYKHLENTDWNKKKEIHAEGGIHKTLDGSTKNHHPNNLGKLPEWKF